MENTKGLCENCISNKVCFFKKKAETISKIFNEINIVFSAIECENYKEV